VTLHRRSPRVDRWLHRVQVSLHGDLDGVLLTLVDADDARHSGASGNPTAPSDVSISAVTKAGLHNLGRRRYPAGIQMDERTVTYYDEHALELSDRYESADMSHVHDLLARHLPRNASVFEIGGGTGRDAAYLVSAGYDVTSVDASVALLEAAVALHPELRSRVHNAAFPLPETSHFLALRYDAVISIAVLMHVPDDELPRFASQVRRLLKDGGVFVLSVSTGRVVGEGDRDAGGRLFRERGPAEIVSLFEEQGLSLQASRETRDTLGRDVVWHFLVFRSGDSPA
jgi:SAM-dependent methyltransferase